MTDEDGFNERGVRMLGPGGKPMMTEEEVHAMMREPGFVPLAFRPDFDREKHEAEVVADGAVTPTFDHELEEKQNLVDAGIMHAGGKGPSPGYAERHRAIARYNALGFTNNQIAEKLGYSPTAVSLALKKPHIQAEVERFRTQFFDEDINRALKAAGSDAIKHIHKTILDDAEKSELRSTNSRWVVEKLTGKAKQEVNVESNTLAAFTDLLREVRESGRPLEPAVLDITPSGEAGLLESGGSGAEGPALESDPGPDFDAWLDKNL